jgi:hypothetical protein
MGAKAIDSHSCSLLIPSFDVFLCRWLSWKHNELSATQKIFQTLDTAPPLYSSFPLNLFLAALTACFDELLPLELVGPA